MALPLSDDRALALGLGIYDESVSDKIIADEIRENVRGIYSWVMVQSINHSYGNGIAKKTRAITVRPENWQVLCDLIKALWSQRIIHTDINVNRAVSAILGSGDAQDLEHLKKAADNKYKITIYFAMDKSNVDMAVVESPLWCQLM